MKITARQLREMIEEELTNVMGPIAACDCGCGDPTCDCPCPECSGGHSDSADGDCDPDEGHDGVSMARSELLKIQHAVEGICEMLEGCNEIPAWVESKIATSADRIDAVYHYMQGQKAR